MSDSEEQKNEKKAVTKKKRKPIVIIIAFIVLLAAAGIIGYSINGARSTPSARVPENFISYPTVSSTVSSARDNETHSVDVDFVIEYNGDSHESISHDAIYNEMMSALGKMDYEHLKSVDSVERVENHIKEAITNVTGEEAVTNVYVSNIVIDFPNAIREQAEEPSATQRMRGLFKNLN